MRRCYDRVTTDIINVARKLKTAGDVRGSNIATKVLPFIMTNIYVDMCMRIT